MPSRVPQDYGDDETLFESDWPQINDDFSGMRLRKGVLKGIYAYGLEKPSPIQERAIVPLVKGKDVIMQAQSGTGKTAAFVIGILQRLDLSRSITQPQALILLPTRELAQQTQKVFLAIGQYLPVNCITCIGGIKPKRDIKKLEQGAHIVVGTPGRIAYLLERKALVTDKIKVFCIDEADKMLEHTFKEQLMDVFEYLLPRRDEVQVVLLSATFPDDLTGTVMRANPAPIKILVKRRQLTLEGIKQVFILMDTPAWKLETLCDLYTTETFTHPTVVFCNTRSDVIHLLQQLETRQLPATATHGKIPQRTRERLLQDFRVGASRVIITTDMLARGIDVQQVAVVINYDLPEKKEDYMHRIGRSGRFGRKGIAINFITKEDIEKLREIEEYYNTDIEEMPLDISILLRRISLED